MSDAPDSPAAEPTSTRPQARPVQHALDAAEAERAFAVSMSNSMSGSFMQMISAMSRSPAARRYSTSRSPTAPGAPAMPSMDGLLLEDDDGGSDSDGDHLQSEPASPVPGRSSRPDDAPSPADQAHDEDSATSSAESSDGDDEHMQRSTASLGSAPGSPRRPRRMASSIHAIHQPLAQARESADAVGSDAADSEPASPEAGPSGLRFTSPVRSPSSSTLLPPRDRSATVTDRRKQSSDRIRQLAEKLREVFDLDEAEEVIAEFPCWLFRRVLLQGYLYVTPSRILFYAYIRQKHGSVIRTGSLNKRSSRTRRSRRHWFVLRSDSLSWYPSSTSLYFPSGDVSLHYVTSVVPSSSNALRFKVLTPERRLVFTADSAAAREDWIKTIRKAVFACQNEGESVKIAIPLERVVAIERSSMEFVDSLLLLRVFNPESGGHGARDDHDDYPLCYFTHLDTAEAALRGTWERFRAERDHPTDGNVVDTTLASVEMERGKSSSSGSEAEPPMEGRLEGADPFPFVKPVGGRLEGESAAPLTAEPEADAALRDRERDGDSYPPSTPMHAHGSSASTMSWAEWIKSRPKRILTAPGRSGTLISAGTRRVSEVLSSAASLATSSSAGGGGSTSSGRPAPVVEAADADDEHIEARASDRFRTHFSMPESEEVQATYAGYFFRTLPVFGKIYLSTNYFCFRASVVKTKLVLPLTDIVAVEPHRADRLGYSGLVLVIKGHEELFFEFGAREKRDALAAALDVRIEELLVRAADDVQSPPTTGLREAQALRALEPSGETSVDELAVASATQVEDAPPAMFRSTSSTFVTFRPAESLHFTCLTIGSRGDVQPYLALCKGLQAQGHRCRIATHGEYRDWIEGHGIEFASVGGDPAELMRICVENGMFTYSFIREGVAKFRGWLDELLKSAWTACQDTDVLIESPSAMAGLHIAEALQIPYFRAFTMPWSRTRAYPHAFAVPEVKLGGQYNWLSYTMFDSFFWRAISGQVNRWRKHTLGLHSTSQDKMDAHKHPFLYNFSPSVVPPPLDWPEWIHVTGYWFLDAPDDSKTKKWEPPAALLAFLERAQTTGKKVVYIGFGSIVVSDPEGLTRTISEGVERAGVMAIVSKGWSDRLASKNESAASKHEREAQDAKEKAMMPESIYTIDAIPHDWLFSRIDAAVHHGGAGTTGASLRAGISTCIRPFFGDQFFNAKRVEALGVGSSIRKMTVDALADALVLATTDEKQIARAKLIGEKIRAEDGVSNAIESIYRDLEYARTLIKRDTRREARAPQSSAPASAPSSREPSRAASRERRHPTAIAHSSSGTSEASWDRVSQRAADDDDDDERDDVLSRDGIGSSSAGGSASGDRGRTPSPPRRTASHSRSDDELSRRARSASRKSPHRSLASALAP